MRNINNDSYVLQFMYLILICFGCLIVGQFISIGIALAAGYDITKLAGMNPSDLSRGELQMMKMIQILSSLFIFIIPALIFSWLKTGNRYAYSRLLQGVKPLGVVLATFALLAAMPLVNWMVEINQAMSLPASLSSFEQVLRSMEEQTADMINAFLSMNGSVDLLINMLMMAVLPAVGEELLFRGSLQRLLREWSKRPHLAIWLSAFIFSFIHFQFYGFLPRMVLGALLGYLFYWGGSLWYPIIAHFLNNGLQVLAVHLGWIELPENAMEQAQEMPWFAVLIGTAIFGACMYVFYQQTFKSKYHEQQLGENL